MIKAKTKTNHLIDRSIQRSIQIYIMEVNKDDLIY